MELTKADWAKADAIARELALDVDRNELGKVVAYAHRTRDIKKILALVNCLPDSGYVRSNRTRGYMERIADVLNRQIGREESERALKILSWAFRLMTTYQTEMGTGTAGGRTGRRL